MIWLLLAFMGALVVGLVIGYFISVKMIGKQATKRQFRDLLPLMVLIYVTMFGLGFLESPYKDIVFPGVYTLFLFLWLLSWPIRRRAAGRVLLNAGKPPQNKFLVWFGFIEAACAFALTWDVIARPQLYSEGWASTVSLLGSIWLLALLFVVLGMSKLELREKGMCYLFRYIAWERMSSCQWEPERPTMLTIRYTPRLPFLPRLMTIKIPAIHRDEIDRIAAEQLSDHRLSASV